MTDGGTTLRFRFPPALWLAATLLFAGCASLPPGFDAPKVESFALAQPETTTLGKRFDARAKQVKPLKRSWIEALSLLPLEGLL